MIGYEHYESPSPSSPVNRDAVGWAAKFAEVEGTLLCGSPKALFIIHCSLLIIFHKFALLEKSRFLWRTCLKGWPKSRKRLII